MSSIFIGELAGTATLLYLGNGVVANMLLKDTKGSGTGLLAIAAAWAFAVTIAIYVSTYFGSSGAHLNPIVTIAGCEIRGLEFISHLHRCTITGCDVRPIISLVTL